MTSSCIPTLPLRAAADRIKRSRFPMPNLQVPGRRGNSCPPSGENEMSLTVPATEKRASSAPFQRSKSKFHRQNKMLASRCPLREYAYSLHWPPSPLRQIIFIQDSHLFTKLAFHGKVHVPLRWQSVRRPAEKQPYLHPFLLRLCAEAEMVIFHSGGRISIIAPCSRPSHWTNALTVRRI